MNRRHRLVLEQIGTGLWYAHEIPIAGRHPFAVLDRMEDLGLIEGDRCSEGRRRYNITGHGRAELARVQAWRKHWLLRWFA